MGCEEDRLEEEQEEQEEEEQQQQQQERRSSSRSGRSSSRIRGSRSSRNLQIAFALVCDTPIKQKSWCRRDRTAHG